MAQVMKAKREETIPVLSGRLVLKSAVLSRIRISHFQNNLVAFSAHKLQTAINLSFGKLLGFFLKNQMKNGKLLGSVPELLKSLVVVSFIQVKTDIRSLRF